MLLTTSNPKTDKGMRLGYLTAILHLSPHESGGRGNVCPWATPGCIAACLNTAGRGGIGLTTHGDNTVQAARRERTRLFFEDRPAFLDRLNCELSLHARKAGALGLRAAARLNGTSDLPWEKLAPELFAAHPRIRFYDYTKSTQRAARAHRGNAAGPYHLTLSKAETRDAAWVGAAVRLGVNVAVVFGIPRGGPLPPKFAGARVIDGDEHDLRFLDPRGVVVGLRAKGRAKHDSTWFVVREPAAALEDAPGSAIAGRVGQGGPLAENFEPTPP